MSEQLEHIRNNYRHIVDRASIIKKIREFFWSQNFIEVETPNILALPGQEPYLSPMKLVIHNERGEKKNAYLHTSPEYAMKKMLASGFQNIFSICKCYRNNESFGGEHNPEFTMLEWYRVGVDFNSIMDDVEMLFNYISDEKIEFERLHMRDLWDRYVGINLDNYLDKDKMFPLCVEKGFLPSMEESFEDLFYRIFLNLIEPNLKGYKIIHHYPAQMAALSKFTDDGYAERFEVYINGLEIANAFSELTDAGEQRKRLEEERKLRIKMKKDVYDIDLDFIEAVGKLPKCAGIALGVDRLVQVLLGCKNIDDVLVLPLSITLSPNHLIT
ncbi:MAG: EF-P lysine aminoacylase EpmA [bacterium]|nr:EF-P lysine aminoacylase EpmA [bacterium]